MAITYRVRNLRILSLPRKKLKRRPATPNTILTESGQQLRTESNETIRTEQ